MPNYPEKYADYIRMLTKGREKEPATPNDAFKLIIKHGYLDAVTWIGAYIKANRNIPGYPKMPEELYPEFVAYKISDSYLDDVKKHILVIRQKIAEYNDERAEDKRKDLGEGINKAVESLEDLIYSI